MSGDILPAATSPKKEIRFLNPEEYLDQLQEQDDQIKKFQQEAKEIYAKKGELCDSEGFYQHSGECWSDALQQVMNNADTLKEKVQKKYIDLEFTDDYEFPDEMFLIKHDPLGHDYITTVDRAVFQVQKRWVLLYLKEAQKRFLRHYILESKRRNFKAEICKTHEPFAIAKEQIKHFSKQFAYRGQGKEGRLSALFGVLKKLPTGKGLRPALEDYMSRQTAYTGGTDRDIETLLNVYNYVFFDKKLDYSYLKMSELHSTLQYVETEKGFDEYLDSISGILFGIQRPKAGHEMAFYSCGTKLFFYEDNYGSVEFNWKLFLKEYWKFAREQREQEKTKRDFEALEKEFNEVQADPAKKEEFEKLKGSLFAELKAKYTDNVLNGKTIYLLTLSTLKFKGPEYKTSFYPCFYISRGPPLSMLAHTCVQGKLYEVDVQTGKPLKLNEGSENEITLEPQMLDTYVYDSFFILYKLGVEKDTIKNTGFEFDENARLNRQYLLMDIIDKNEKDVLKELDEDYFFSDVLQDAIFLAIHLNSQKILEKLLAKNVFLHARTPEGHTPISLAITEKKPEIVKMLLKKDTNPNLKTYVGYKAFTLPFFSLMADIAGKSTAFVDVLLEDGFDVNTEFEINFYPFTYTLLYLAYKFKSIELIQFLCSKGAKLDKMPSIIQSTTAKTLLELAKEEGASQEILTALETCSAPVASGGRHRKTRKHKIEKTHRNSRKSRQ
jgi:hypothetical protein